MQKKCSHCGNIKKSASIEDSIPTAKELDALVLEFGDPSDTENYFADEDDIRAAAKGIVYEVRALAKMSNIPLTSARSTAIQALLEDAEDDLRLFKQGDFSAVLSNWNAYEKLGKHVG